MNHNTPKKQYKAQATVEAYTYFVIKGLVGIKGTSISDVVSHFIRTWIEQNHELLKEYELTVQDWRNQDD